MIFIPTKMMIKSPITPATVNTPAAAPLFSRKLCCADSLVDYTQAIKLQAYLLGGADAAAPVGLGASEESDGAGTVYWPPATE